MPRIISLSSYVVAGRVGQSIATFALQFLGIDVWALPTVLSLQPRAGALRGGIVPQEIFQAIIGEILRLDLSTLSGLHIGYLRTSEQVRAAITLIEAVRSAAPHAIVALDPVMGDAGAFYIPEATAQSVKRELSWRADILTPNLFELACLAGRPVVTEREAIDAARSLGARLVAVTSAPCDEPDGMAALLMTQEACFRARHAKLDRAPHGTGDLFAALFLARLVRGEAAQEAFALALSSVYSLVIEAGARALSYLPSIECADLLEHPRHRIELTAP